MNNLRMADSLTALLQSQAVRSKTEEQVARNIAGAPRSIITSIYTKLCRYTTCQDTVVGRRYSVLKKSGTGADNEIAVRLAQEEIVFYIMCEKFRGEEAAMECEMSVAQGVKRRSSKRKSNTNRNKKLKLNME